MWVAFPPVGEMHKRTFEDALDEQDAARNAEKRAWVTMIRDNLAAKAAAPFELETLIANIEASVLRQRQMKSGPIHVRLFTHATLISASHPTPWTPALALWLLDLHTIYHAYDMLQPHARRASGAQKEAAFYGRLKARILALWNRTHPTHLAHWFKEEEAEEEELTLVID